MSKTPIQLRFATSKMPDGLRTRLVLSLEYFTQPDDNQS